MPKRDPPLFYIQIIIDVNSRTATKIDTGTRAYISGWASCEEVDKSPKRDFGSKFGRKGGYTCHYISIRDLHSMDAFIENYQKRNK